MWKNDQAPCNWKMLDKKQASQAIHIWKGGRVMEKDVSYFGVLLFMIMICIWKENGGVSSDETAANSSDTWLTRFYSFSGRTLLWGKWMDFHWKEEPSLSTYLFWAKNWTSCLVVLRYFETFFISEYIIFLIVTFLFYHQSFSWSWKLNEVERNCPPLKVRPAGLIKSEYYLRWWVSLREMLQLAFGLTRDWGNVVLAKENK